MEESAWLAALAAALPAAGRHEVHYTNAAGYWLGLSAAAADMSADTDARTRDEIVGLLAFSHVLARVAERVLATRFGYFQTVVDGGLGAGARYAASVETDQARRRASVDGEEEDEEEEGEEEEGVPGYGHIVKCSSAELAAMCPPGAR
jgi:hypothetical protein